MNAVAVTQTVALPVPKAAALAALWNIQNIARFEPKAETVRVNLQGHRSGTFSIRGHIAGLPWSSEFRYRLNERGFHSEELHTHRSGLRVSGGFRVYEWGATDCCVVHYEHYALPVWAVPFKPVIGWYVRRSMKQELVNLSRLITDSSDAGRAA